MEQKYDNENNCNRIKRESIRMYTMCFKAWNRGM